MKKLEEIRRLLIEDQLIEAITLLIGLPNLSDLDKNDLSILLSRVQDLNRRLDIGVVSLKEDNLERNRLRNSILNFATLFLKRETKVSRVKKNPPVKSAEISMNFVGELDYSSDIIFRINWSPCGRYLACPTKDMKVLIWDTERFEILQEFKFLREVNAVQWLGNSIELACGLDGGKSYVLNLEKKSRQEINVGQVSVTCFALSPDGLQLALGGTSRRLFLWDKSSNILSDDLYEHRDIIWALDWSTDGLYLASGSRDKNICIWDTRSKKLTGRLKGHRRYVTSVKWVPNSNRYLLSASDDETIRLWDVVEGVCVKVFEHHTDRVNSVSVSHDGKFFASKSNDETLRIFDLQSLEEIYVISELSSNFVFPSIEFNPLQLVLASFGKQDTSVRLWEINKL